jgi:hypothetical protein
MLKKIKADYVHADCQRGASAMSQEQLSALSRSFQGMLNRA